MNIESKVLKISALVVGSIVLFIVFILVFGLAVQLLWNNLLPELFNLPAISFMQACGLLALAKLFFGVGGSNFNFKAKNADKTESEQRYKKEFSRWLMEKKRETEQQSDSTNQAER